jgi:uncharacterized protein YkwD
MNGRRVLLLIAFTIVLTLAACGGSDEERAPILGTDAFSEMTGNPLPIPAGPPPTLNSLFSTAGVSYRLSNVQQAVLDLVNEERCENDLVPLKLDDQLTAAAEIHSADMALNRFFDHTSPDGSNPGSRATAQGYDWVMVGENIAAGQSTPEEVVNGAYGWMNSENHRANILDPEFRDMGIAYIECADCLAPAPATYSYVHWWTQTFGTTWDDLDATPDVTCEELGF